MSCPTLGRFVLGNVQSRAQCPFFARRRHVELSTPSETKGLRRVRIYLFLLSSVSLASFPLAISAPRSSWS